MIYATPTWVILVSVIAAAAVIAIVAYVIYRTVRPKMKEDKPSEEDVAKEELDRLLTPIDDEETLAEMSEFARREAEEEDESVEKHDKE